MSIARQMGSSRYATYCLDRTALTNRTKMHVDTPRSEAHIGSLVVCLPVSHKGGELCFHKTGTDNVFDWSDTSNLRVNSISGEIDKDSIHWAAFYGDFKHSIKEGTSGHRLTLSYNLYATRKLNTTLCSTRPKAD